MEELADETLMGISIAILGQNHKLWKNAPVAVGFSREGLQADFGKRSPPVGHAGFVAWNEMAGIDSLPEAVESLQLAWDLRDTDQRKTVVIRKKSGTAYILGPVDPEIVDALRRRMVSS